MHSQYRRERTTSAIYTLAEDPAALRSAFDEVMSRSTTVVCPGNIQSPGPWRRNANPTVAAGTLYCGTDGGKAVIAWTTDSDLLLNVVQADGRAMDGLYRWLSTHTGRLERLATGGVDRRVGCSWAIKAVGCTQRDVGSRVCRCGWG